MLTGCSALVQDWLADDRYADSRLVVLTRGAVGDDGTDLAGAAVWGLVRSAQAEHPGRFVLVDVDAGRRTCAAVAAPWRSATGEPQVAVRDGVRLGAAGSPARSPARTTAGAAACSRDGHGAGHRRHRRAGRAGGPAPGDRARGAGTCCCVAAAARTPPGAAELVARAGRARCARSGWSPCDVADRDALAALLAAVRPSIR